MYECPLFQPPEWVCDAQLDDTVEGVGWGGVKGRCCTIGRQWWYRGHGSEWSHCVHTHILTVVWMRLVVVVCGGQCGGNAVITADLTCIGPY